MGSSPVDKATQQSSSAAATQVSQQQVANAAAAQKNSNAAFATLFGSPTASGSLSGGTASQFLDPSKLNQTGLTGTYQNAYTTTANQTAEAAKRATSSTLQSLNSRGMGATPSGFAADQLRKAQSDAAATNAQTYSGLSQQQLSDSLQNYWNATNALSQYGTGQQTAALTGNANAQSTNTSLYGTASQQKANPLTSVLSAGLGAAGAVGAAAIGR